MLKGKLPSKEKTRNRKEDIFVMTQHAQLPPLSDTVYRKSEQNKEVALGEGQAEVHLRFRCYNVHIPLKLLIHWFSRIYRPILTRTGNLCAQASYRRRNKPAKNVTLSPVQPQCFCQHRGWSHVFPPVSSSPFSLWLSLCLCIFCRVV